MKINECILSPVSSDRLKCCNRLMIRSINVLMTAKRQKGIKIND